MSESQGTDSDNSVMKSPTKINDMTPSMRNKKLVQATLPFKALSNVTPTKPLAQSPKRKRKLSATITSDAPAAKKDKHSRKSVVKDVADDDDDVTTIDLSSPECMEASVDLVISNVNKENECAKKLANSDDGSSLDSENESSDRDEQIVTDEEGVVKSPKAKKSLDMGRKSNDATTPRRSTRISDDSFKIKLPMVVKKEKETAKKAKKKPKNGGNKSDSGKDKSSENVEEVQEVSDETVVTKLVTTSSTLSQISNQSNSAKKKTNNSLNTTFESPVRGNLNDSTASAPMTPVQNLTPKQLLRKAESEKKMLEKQRAKEERDRKMQEAKEQKQREKDEKERQKEEERRQREEEKERKRLAELEASTFRQEIF